MRKELENIISKVVGEKEVYGLCDVLRTINELEERANSHIFNEVEHILDGIGDGDTFRVLDYIAWFGWDWENDDLDKQSKWMKNYIIKLLKKGTKMNKETYEALKRVIMVIKPSQKDIIGLLLRDIKQVEDWIDEVGKEDKWDTCGRWIEEKNPE